MDQDAKKLRRSIAAVLLSGAFASGGALAQESLRSEGASASADVEVFVQLATPSVAEFNAAALQSAGALPDGNAQKAHAHRVSTEQAAFRASVEAVVGGEAYAAQRVGANGFRVRASAAQIETLRGLPGVRSVGAVEIHELDHVQSVPWVGAPEFWAAHGLTGESIKVGVIDSGIDYTHANFGGPGTVAAYTSNVRNVIEPGTFPTAKVVGGYDFAGPTYNAQIAGSTPTPDPDPIDVGGHGSHVAGSVAGLGVPGSIGAGVAPGAKLYALKVFSDAGGSTGLTSLALEWAMDPNGDGDMSDRLDVVNMSLGSSFGSPADPSSISANSAAAVGIVVVASAGNSGDVPYVTGAPAVADAAISVAANTPGGRLYPRVTVTEPASVAGVKQPALEGAGPVTIAQTGTIADDLVLASPADGCTPLTNAAAVNGNVALIIRGGCSFLAKYQQAQAAGARAIVVYNSGPPPGAGDPPIVMGGLNASVTIPGVMISHTHGAALAAATGVKITLEAALDPTQDDIIATFSSRGPGHGGSTFKPDLSAPGVAIISTAVGTGVGSANFQGTSMAAPHVAGAAALLREQHPKLPQAAIKAMLMNSTATIVNGDLDVARHGVGAMRVDDAGELSSFASPAGVSFGRVNVAQAATLQRKSRLANLEAKHRSFTVQHVAGQTYPGVSVSCPTNVSVGPKAESKFNITLSFDPAAAFAANVFDNASISQSEVDGWCVLGDGADTLRVAYLAVVDSASRIVANGVGRSGMQLRNTGPALGVSEGFTWNNASKQSNLPHAIRQIGFRAADPDLYFGDQVIEFGIETAGGWEHISNLGFELFLDTDKDGDDDVRLEAADRSSFQANVALGQFVTAQFVAGSNSGFLDWLATGWDFNDRVVVLPFTRTASGGLVSDSFNYRLVITGRDGTSDTLTGSIDLAKEVHVDINSFALDPGSSVDVSVTSGEGYFLWLSPNDTPDGQSDEIDAFRRAAKPEGETQTPET